MKEKNTLKPPFLRNWQQVYGVVVILMVLMVLFLTWLAYEYA